MSMARTLLSLLSFARREGNARADDLDLDSVLSLEGTYSNPDVCDLKEICICVYVI
jgi:hypothetical protein